MVYWFYKIPGYSRFDIFTNFDAEGHIADGVRGERYTYNATNPAVVAHEAEFDLPLLYFTGYQSVTLVECRMDYSAALPVFFEARYREIGANPLGYLHCTLAAAQTLKFMHGARWSGAPGRLYNPVLPWSSFEVNISPQARRQYSTYDLSGNRSYLFCTGALPDGSFQGDQGEWGTIIPETGAEPWWANGYILGVMQNGGLWQFDFNYILPLLLRDFPDFNKNITRMQLIPSTFLPALDPLTLGPSNITIGKHETTWGIWRLANVNIVDWKQEVIPRSVMNGSAHAQAIKVRVGFKDAFELDPKAYYNGVYLAARLFRTANGLSCILKASPTLAFPNRYVDPAVEFPLYEPSLIGVSEPLSFAKDYLPSILQAAAGTANALAQGAAGNVVGALSSGGSAVSAVIDITNKSPQQMGGKPTVLDPAANIVSAEWYTFDNYDERVGYDGTFRLRATPDTDQPTPPTGGWWEGGNVKLLWVDQQANLAVTFDTLSDQLSQEYAQSRVYCH